MSVTYVSAELRRLVGARAEGLCEYCLIEAEWCQEPIIRHLVPSLSPHKVRLELD